MTLTRPTPLGSFLLTLALTLAGCGDDGAGDGSTDGPAATDAFVATDAGSPTTSHLTLQVPAELVGTPERLYVITSEVAPVAGPPSGILHVDESVTIEAGDTIELDLDVRDITGDHYLVAVLYMEGGGRFSPSSGVDYAAYSEAPLTFDGSPLELGTLTFALAE